jgi:hypothetical protein
MIFLSQLHAENTVAALTSLKKGPGFHGTKIS